MAKTTESMREHRTGLLVRCFLLIGFQGAQNFFHNRKLNTDILQPKIEAS
ncbi:hypothetical protein LMIY3S_00506 [Labrys miyagiensis]